MSRVFLTGAATLVGAEILRELSARSDVERILLLVPTEESERSSILDRLAAYAGPLPPPVEPLAGDLRLPRFGLPLAAWESLTGAFDIGIHCAQREVKDQNLELARQANVRPLENWIQLLSRNPAMRLHHLSTAFVGGTRRGLFTEFDLDCGQSFHNAWEKSKFEAEVRLRESRVADRVTIYRPSHTLGRSDTGACFEHGGAYPLLATLAAALILPGDFRAHVDFVPVDYVAASMVALALAGASGTFHLACDWDGSLTASEAASLAAKGRGRSRGAMLLPRAIAWPLRLAGSATLGGLTSRGLAFTTARDLLHQGPTFDTYLADLALKPLGIVRPDARRWLEPVVRAAEQQNWQAPPAGELDKPVAAAALPVAAAEMALTLNDPALREKRFHQIGDVNVAYRDIGTGEPVVFLHGLAGAHAWDAVVQRMAGNWRTIVVETLGLGDSEGPADADLTLAAQAARVRHLLSALDIPAAHIVGNDAGGVIAQIFAVRWPSCVRSLVLSDCNAARPSAHLSWGRILRLPGGAVFLAALLKVTAFARSKSGFGKLVNDEQLLTDDRLARLAATLTGDRSRRMRFRRFFRSLDQTDAASLHLLMEQFEAPTMIVWGAEDACSSTSWAKSLYDAVPGAERLELIPFAGVSCHEERPDLFAQLLTEFFSGPHHTSGTRAPVSRI